MAAAAAVRRRQIHFLIYNRRHQITLIYHILYKDISLDTSRCLSNIKLAKICPFFPSAGQLSIDNGGPIDNDFGSNLNPNPGNTNSEGISPPGLTIGGNIDVSSGPIVGPTGGGNGNGGSDGASAINGINGVNGGGAGTNGSLTRIA